MGVFYKDINFMYRAHAVYTQGIFFPWRQFSEMETCLRLKHVYVLLRFYSFISSTLLFHF